MSQDQLLLALLQNEAFTPPRTLPLSRVCQALELALRVSPALEIDRLLQLLLEQIPQAHSLQVLRGQLYGEHTQQRSQALRLLSQATRRHPLDAPAWAALASTLAGLQRPAAARAALVRAALHDPLGAEDALDEPARLQAAEAARGVRALQQGLADQALWELERAVRAQPRRMDLRLHYIEALRRNQGLERARAELQLFAEQRNTVLPVLWLTLALQDSELLDELSTLQQRVDPEDRLARRFFAPEALPWAALTSPELPWNDLLQPLTPLLALAAQERRRKALIAHRAPLETSTPTPPEVQELVETASRIVARLSSPERTVQRISAPLSKQPTQIALYSSKAFGTLFGAAATQALRQRLVELAQILQRQDKPLHLVDLDEPASLVVHEQLAGIRLEPGANGLAVYLRRVAANQRELGRDLESVLLLGGEQCIPFFHLPNTIPDGDHEILSDTPYACDSPASVVPLRCVARLPDAGSAEFLIEQLDRMCERHARPRGQPRVAWWRSMLGRETGRQSQALEGLGYAAEIWRNAAIGVLEGVSGLETPLLSSPPLVAERLAFDGLDCRLLYANLHGAEGSPNWYGQPALPESGAATRLPIALTPALLRSLALRDAVLLSEACYGMELAGRTAAQSIPLAALAQGALLAIGSTVNAYGSSAPPLVGADLLSHLILQGLSSGQSVAQAWIGAHARFAETMERQQGYLDELDLKTMLSFVLYGDPWAQPVPGAAAPVTATHVLRTPAPRDSQGVIGESDVAPAVVARAQAILRAILPQSGLRSLLVRRRAALAPAANGAKQLETLTFTAQDVSPTVDGYYVTQAAHLTMCGTDVVKIALTR